MFRTAEAYACPWRTIHSIMLLILACCLVVHFLVEDISLQSVVDPSSQSWSASGLAFDELEHQDDLALVAHLSEPFPHNDPPAIPAWGIRLERQPAVPIRIPPKIA